MDDEGDRRPPLCPSTIRFLADQGLIDPSYAGFGVEDLLQHLQTGASDERGVNDLTDIEVDENSVCEILEPKGVNPQQQVFSEQPDGPVALVEQSKALIARQPHPNKNWLEGELKILAPSPLIPRLICIICRLPPASSPLRRPG